MAINEPRDDKFKVQWLKFWDSEMGKQAIQDFKELAFSEMAKSMSAKTQEEAAYYAWRAAGVEYVLDYVLLGVEAGETVEKEAKKKA